MASRARRFDWLAAAVSGFVWVLCAVPFAGQSTVGTPETADALLERMSLAAGVIFAGEVAAVRRPTGLAGSAQDAAEGVVEIDLRVDQPLRGPAAGSIYTLREWAGLWACQAQRFRAGQRLLLFLYPPDMHGLSAPVHGPDGAIPLRGSGIAPGPDDATTVAAEWLVDLRWLQAQVPQRRAWTMLPARGPASQNTLRGIIAKGGKPPPIEDEWTSLESDPMLIHAIREPRQLPTPAPADVQPLSQVLALCHQAMTLDAMRRRNAGR